MFRELRRRCHASGEVHQQAEDAHHPDDHRARRQIGHQRHAQPDDIAADRERVADQQLPLRRMPVGRDGRHDQAGEHQIHADELHGRGHDEREQHVEADAADALAPLEPHQREHRGQHGGANQLVGRHPQDLPGQQVLEVLAAMRIVG